jgi:hypothetical protein
MGKYQDFVGIWPSVARSAGLIPARGFIALCCAAVPPLDNFHLQDSSTITQSSAMPTKS